MASAALRPLPARRDRRILDAVESSVEVAPDLAEESPPGGLEVRFEGTSREYFRIWVVNTSLSILTLGIFSAWAKVRRKRYIYSNTVVDGTPFQYLARPLPILKGRLVAATLAATYYVSTYFWPGTLPYVVAVAVPFVPFLLMRSLAFNARYSAFRAMTFRFEGGYGRAAMVGLLGGPGLLFLVDAVPVSTSGMYLGAAVLAVWFVTFPWWQKAMRRYVVEHTSFGGRSGEFRVPGRAFLWVYVRAGFVFLLAAMVLGSAAGVLFAALEEASDMDLEATMLTLVGYGAALVSFAYVRARVSNLVWNGIRLGPVTFESTLSARKMISLYFTNTIGILASLGLATPWAEMRTLRYRMDCLRAFLHGEESGFRGVPGQGVSAVSAEVGEIFDLDMSF